jgi:glycosyltransferase involved in cell wall biosynthesis
MAASTSTLTTEFRRFALVSNALDPPPDEGIKRTAHELASVFRQNGAVVHAVEARAPLLERKLLIAPRVVSTLRSAQVRQVVYVPTQAATVGSLLRAKILRVLAGVDVAVVALQPRPLPRRSKVISRLLAPSVVLTPSAAVLDDVRRYGWRARFIPPGVDHDRFAPVSAERKRELRLKHGIDERARVVLHVGHARPGRGLEWLEALPGGLCRIVVVGTSLGADRTVVSRLERAGVRVVDTYVSAVEELYQLADVYVFPVRNDEAAIAAPLSVLEAMASNLSVVTTRFGALPDLFTEGPAFAFADDPTSFGRAVRAMLELRADEVQTRELVSAYGWREVGRRAVEIVEDVCRTR